MAEEKIEKKDDDLVINDSTKEEVKSETPSHKDLDQAMSEAETEASQPAEPLTPKKKHRWPRKKIVLVATAAVVALVAILMVIPVTRYGILGVFVQRDVTVMLHDSKTNKPVSSVAVELAGKSTTTDAKGVATFKSIPVGSKKVTVHKKYYKDLSVDQTVPLTGNNPSFNLAIEATGRQVPVKVINKITQQPIEGADITADGTSSKTDKSGEATLVLPADKADMDATITGNGYNKASAKVTITEQKDDKNTFAVVPTGKLYFLSKRSGTIDVLKSDLDGSNVETVVKGTGKEDEDATVLLASRDWKYLALKATRDSDRPKLYLIETSSGKLSVIDEGDVEFTPVGWYNSYFMYTLNRDKLKTWEPKHFALKSYNASNASLKVLDETAGEGSDQSKYAYEDLRNVYLLNNEVFYTKGWTTGELNLLGGKNNTVNSIQPDGGNKKVLKTFAAEIGTYFGSARLYKPQEVYFEVYQKYQRTFFEYDDGKLAENKDIGGDNFYTKFYPTYLLSPSSKNAFWYEQRDGKNTLFVGDANGSNGKEIATLSDYTPYGWYTDEYLLVSKGGSELYIISRSNPGSPLKVTDYHKPQVNFAGYGYGYGGF
jgi:hypothetical protein